MTVSSRQAAVEGGGRTPAGTVYVVDPHPLNWLYVTWNTMEEPVRTDESGAIVGACMEDSHWEGATLVVKVRQGIRFQDGEPITAHSIRRTFDEVEIDKLVHEEALSVFLCCPMALVAVNKHVRFTGHAATLELTETEVDEDRWSRRNG